jgi:DNA topoisomerase-1
MDGRARRHVAVKGSQVRFRFIGKGGKQWSVKDRRVAKIIKVCQELPSQEPLQYVGDAASSKASPRQT